MRLVDYTSDVERLREAILQLGVRDETPDGGRVVEAVFDSAKELRDVERPVIIALTDTLQCAGGANPVTLRAKKSEVNRVFLLVTRYKPQISWMIQQFESEKVS